MVVRIHQGQFELAPSGHACAVRSSGQVVCWGENDTYQLGSAGGRALVPRPISGPIAP